jgi:2-polyprenyl-6-methoxyphenol hydroxylase-like FAD-dependent oxidoreductase
MTDDEKTHSKETAQPRVVIVGGGFGGLCAARGLAGAPVSVTLIDKRNYHSTRREASLMTTRRAAIQINPKCERNEHESNGPERTQ